MLSSSTVATANLAVTSQHSIPIVSSDYTLSVTGATSRERSLAAAEYANAIAAAIRAEISSSDLHIYCVHIKIFNCC